MLLKKYDIAGADVWVEIDGTPDVININIKLDVAQLDQEEPDHSPHYLMNYLDLPTSFSTGFTNWWHSISRTVHVKSGAQARFVIRKNLEKIEAAVHAAVLKRKQRKLEIESIL